MAFVAGFGAARLSRCSAAITPDYVGENDNAPTTLVYSAQAAVRDS